MPLSKKDIEELYLSRMKALLGDFPDGHIESSEEPDFLIKGNGTRVGIELTELHRDVQAGAAPLQATEAMQHRTIQRAKQIFVSKGLPIVHCSIIMGDTHIKKDKVEHFAQAIAAIAERNVPGPNQSRTESFEWTNRSYFPEEIDTITVYRLDQLKETFFSAPRSVWATSLTRTDIERILASKNSKYPAYRTKCDQAWLLINVDIDAMSTWHEFNKSSIALPFNTPFDRVFVLRHFAGEIHELRVLP